MILRLFAIFFILLSSISAHPVIFKNGNVFWIAQNPSFNDIRFGISKTSNWLIGGRFLEDRKSNETFALINNNYLAKRWNNRNSQANLYLLSSAGMNTKNSEIMGNIGMHIDWEDRQFMVMQIIEYFSHNSSFVSNSRLAYSPYKVDYNRMSTWLIAHYSVEYQNEEYRHMFIPVIRLFKGNYLVEFGSNGNNSFLTFMTHF
ncbi:MAG: hypothetical protein O3A49_01550 [Candidatus Marinimicrobia bacterium]|nr:hypothetical protein [Candidatus Neomarinimicrobiota bacterium]MDA0753351.1 hypothetical protein [Candidatus Neomarinimicrobiota bacterium]MDA1363811.1 hypothetical protein [Candidatus Neomarinimicrobiota bacterium]